MPVSPSSCAAILTAAGLSDRMGRPKAELDWFGRTLRDHQLQTLAAFGDRLVIGGPKDALPPEVSWIPNSAPELGRSRSIALGAAQVPEHARAILIVGVDQPLVPEVVDALLRAFEPAQHDLARPVSPNGPGHPVLVSGRLRQALEAVQALPQGLRDLVSAHRDAELRLVTEDLRIHTDMNTPEDYARELASWREALSTG